MTNEESRELKKLYRDIAKKLHPDINPNVTEKDKLLWIRVNDAYRNGDIEELRTLSIMTENIKEYIELEDKNIIDSINDKILSIEKQIIIIIEQINSINSQFPLNIKEQLRNKKWVNERKNEILEKIQILTEKREFLEHLLSEFV
jgi:hypothetical protein